MNQWQPIESAPNGTPVLCYWPPITIGDIKCSAYTGEAWKRFGNWFRTRDGYGAPTYDLNAPTHWMPLPSPPDQSKEVQS